MILRSSFKLRIFGWYIWVRYCLCCRKNKKPKAKCKTFAYGKTLVERSANIKQAESFWFESEIAWAVARRKNYLLLSIEMRVVLPRMFGAFEPEEKLKSLFAISSSSTRDKCFLACKRWLFCWPDVYTSQNNRPIWESLIFPMTLQSKPKRLVFNRDVTGSKNWATIFFTSRSCFWAAPPFGILRTWFNSSVNTTLYTMYLKVVFW